MHCGKSSGLSLAACVVLAILAAGFLREASGQVATGTVRGTVQYEDGRPLSGVWVIIQHDEIGVNYKKDSNPRGQFVFEDLYPGPYSFTISPGQFIVRSPQQIQVRGGRVMDVTVVVARTARNTESVGAVDGVGATEAPPASPASAPSRSTAGRDRSRLGFAWE